MPSSIRGFWKDLSPQRYSSYAQFPKCGKYHMGKTPLPLPHTPGYSSNTKSHCHVDVAHTRMDETASLGRNGNLRGSATRSSPGLPFLPPASTKMNLPCFTTVTALPECETHSNVSWMFSSVVPRMVPCATAISSCSSQSFPSLQKEAIEHSFSIPKPLNNCWVPGQHRGLPDSLPVFA